MAEERNLGVARAPETDEDTTKADLQRRMEEARESITQTVTEIKDTVAQQYNSVKESVTDALDWREQFRRRPVAWSVGALGVGLVVGYSLGGAVIPARDDEDDYAGERDAEYDEGEARAGTSARAIEGGAYGSSEYAAAAMPAQTLAAPRPSYSHGYDQAPAAAEEEDKPGLIERVKESGLIERFKESRAYDRLQDEVSELGNRFMDELSNAARTVVLPALFKKIKELVGVDLSNKQASGQATGGRQAFASNQGSAQGATANQPNAQAGTASASQSGASSGASAGTQSAPSGTGDSRSKFDRLAGDERTPASGGSYDDRYERESQLYARSENRGFGTPARGTESGTDTPPRGSGNQGQGDG